MQPDFSYEDSASSPVCGPVCGIDEVGRGPLAGPVVAAAVVLDRSRLTADICQHINDSKKLTARKRAWLFEKLHDVADISLAQCDAGEIDRINILQATLKAMAAAVRGLKTPPAHALIDGNKAPDLSCRTQTIVKGDAKSLSIAAASIVAKHFRDEMMSKHAIEFPHYGWETNAGYGTAQHLKAIEIHGITRLHRLSFAPISKQSIKQNSAID